MKTISIFGVGNDRVKIEGAMNNEIFFQNQERSLQLAFSDGTVLSVFYDLDNYWQIICGCKGSAKLEKSKTGRNSDFVELTGNIKWCATGFGENPIMRPE